MKTQITTALVCAIASFAFADEATHPIETDALRAPLLQTGGNVLITNVTVHSAVEPAYMGSVLVTGGAIQSIFRGDDVLPADLGASLVIDGTGKHLAPGVIDTHSHMAITGGVNEGTLSITADVDISDSIDPDDPAIYRALAGGVTTIQCLHGSANAIGGRSEVLKLRQNATADEMRFEGAPQGIKFALGENPKGSNWGGNSSRFPGTRPGMQSVYERAFNEARAYASIWNDHWTAVSEGADPAPPRRDLRLEVLAGIIDGTVNVHSHSYRADEIMMLMSIAESFGFRIKTLQHVLEGYKVADEIAKHGAGTSTFSDWWGYKIEAYDAIPQNAALLDAAGVVSTINSDSDELIRHLYLEASKSMRYAGIDAVTALQFCTLNAAVQLGISDKTGSIETGKHADLVLLDGAPMSLYSKVELTFVDGEIEFQRRDAFGFDTAPLEPAPYTGLTQRTGLYAEDPADLTAIVGGTVYTIDAAPIEQGTVLFNGDRIVAVGNSIEVPEGATVIDAFGKSVWPGMIALNTNLGLFEISSVKGTDDTGEIGGDHPDLSVSMSIHPDSAHIAVTRSSGITRNQTTPGGRSTITGQSSVIDLDGVTWQELVTTDRDMLHINFPRQRNDADEPKKTPEAIQKLIDRFEEAREYQRLLDSANGVETLDSRAPGEDADGEGQTSEAKPTSTETTHDETDLATGIPFVKAAAYNSSAPRHNAHLAALAPFAFGHKRIALHAESAQTILAAMKFAKDERFDVVLYGCTEGWKVADRIAAEGFMVVAGPVLSIPRSEFEPYDSRYTNAAALYSAGVQIAIQSGDSENPRNLPFAAGFASTFGLPHHEALKAVTLNAAKVLGLEADLGSLSPGKLADIVITNGDLLDGPTQVEAIFIDGKQVDVGNRHSRLYERYTERLNQVQPK